MIYLSLSYSSINPCRKVSLPLCFFSQAFLGKQGLFAQQCFFSAVCYAWRSSRSRESSHRSLRCQPSQHCCCEAASFLATQHRDVVRQLESQFRLKGETVSPTKFDYCIQSMKQEVAIKVFDLIRNLPANNPYQYLNISGCLLSRTRPMLRQLPTFPGLATCSLPPSCPGSSVFYLPGMNHAFSCRLLPETSSC